MSATPNNPPFTSLAPTISTWKRKVVEHNYDEVNLKRNE